MDGRVIRPALDHISIVAFGQQIEATLEEPHQRLASAAKFHDLVEHQDDRFLKALIQILFKAIANLHEADGRCDDEFAGLGLFVAGRDRTLAQEIEFILIEASLQPQKQTVIALARRIDRLLVNQYRVDRPAHLNELLPVAAVASKPRHFPRGARADLAKADLGDHTVETDTCDADGGRTTKIVINRLNAGPAERRQAITQRILKRALSRL